MKLVMIRDGEEVTTQVSSVEEARLIVDYSIEHDVAKPHRLLSEHGDELILWTLEEGTYVERGVLAEPVTDDEDDQPGR